MAENLNLNKARIEEEDEFYTKLTDIEKELRHYKKYFKNKTIFCNCDDPESSNFWKYFELNFEHLGIKKLISTHFETSKPSYKLELVKEKNNDGKVNSLDVVTTPLRQNGDFRSPECIEFLKESDVIVTNPPFSLFREYVAQLIDYQKDFLIIGNQNAITYKEIFPLLRDDKIWLGYHSGDMEFMVPNYYEPRKTRYREENGIKYRSFGNMCWFTNIDIQKRHEDLILYKNFYGNEDDYTQYDNYDAINVNRVNSIPCDYLGVMGVPITFMDKYNPEQFTVIGLIAGNIKGLAGIPTKTGKDGPYINGRLKYGRILIKRKC
ncbi:MAG: adenine-specific methyltransferase EcoRI family protein [Ignavibacteriales bacterium]|nr:adenine-specific methyltransferase EcoRI family protein [Ignavibacteriales bacterium]